MNSMLCLKCESLCATQLYHDLEHRFDDGVKQVFVEYGTLTMSHSIYTRVYRSKIIFTGYENQSVSVAFFLANQFVGDTRQTQHKRLWFFLILI